MNMSNDVVLERVNEAIDEVERRILEDDRMPGGSSADSNLAIVPTEVRRHERFQDVLETYPAAYVAHGDVDESRLTTKRENFVLNVEVQVFIAAHDPEAGSEDIKDLTLTLRRVFSEDDDVDRHLRQGGATDGKLLANDVRTPSYSWGAFQPLGRGRIEFAGQVMLDIEFNLDG